MRYSWISTIAIGLVAAGSALVAQGQGLVTGTVTYRERIMLPATASLEVTLEDVSRADGPAEVIARTVRGNVRAPMSFDLPYELDDIDGSHRYAVRARIVDGDHILFTSSETVLVLTQGHMSTADLLVRMIAAPVVPPPAPVSAAEAPEPLPMTLPPPVELANLPASFAGTLSCADCAGVRYDLTLYPDDAFLLRTTRIVRGPVAKGTSAPAPVDSLGSWVRSSDRRAIVLETHQGTRHVFAVVDDRTLRHLDADGLPVGAVGLRDLRRASKLAPVPVRTTMTGVYRVEGETTDFTECSTGQRWAVSDTGAAAELRAAAGKAGSRAGGRAGNAVFATVEAQLAPGTSASGSSLAIARVSTATKGRSCAPRFGTVPLEKTSWRLTQLAGSPVSAQPGPAGTPGLTFREDSSSFGGHGGCNRVTGAYRTNGEDLRLQGIGTLKACPTITDRETQFRTALIDTRSFRILGRTLDLFNSDRRSIARFEAVD